MTQPRDPEAIIASWLEDGPTELPAETRRAIGVGLRTQPRARRMAILGGSAMNPLSRLAAAAAIVLAVGGLSAFVLSNRGGGAGSTPSPAPTSSPLPSPSSSASADAPSTAPTLATFSSPKYGYTVRYPADWVTGIAATTGPWSPEASPEPTGDPFDHIDRTDGGGFRAASALVPDGVVVDDWISQFITHSDVPACSAPRNTLEQVTIDGHAGRLRSFCGEATEIEATVVVGNRVYVFTLFRGPRTTSEAEERAQFDTLLASIRLNPADAEVAPSAKPS